MPDNRIASLGRRRTQVHVALRRGELRVASQLLGNEQVQKLKLALADRAPKTVDNVLTAMADALGQWRGCRRCADIDEREVIASRCGRTSDWATD